MSRIAAVRGVIAAAGLLTALALPLITSPEASATLNMQASDTSAAIVVSSLSPTDGSIDNGQTLAMSGTVTNNASFTLDDLRVWLVVSQQAVQSRSQLQTIATGTGAPVGQTVVDWSAPNALQPGATVSWTLQWPTDQLGFGVPGVYPVGVEATAADPTGGGRSRYGAVRTFVAWQVAKADPTPVSVLMPLIGNQPATYGTSESSSLAAQLGPKGRLGITLAAGSVPGLTWMLDPDTLAQASSLSKGDVTNGARAGPVPADESATAALWLDHLRLVLQRGAGLAVPFADPDLVATVDGGLSADITAGELLGAQVTRDVLGASLPENVAWPADGTADGQTLTALAGLRSVGVILSDRYTSTVQQLSYTPAAIGPVGGSSVPGIVADSELSDLFTATPGSGGAVITQQRVLAEIAMITEEQPFAPRSVVIVPPRRWTPTAGYTSALLSKMAAAPWVKISTLPSLLAAAPTSSAPQRRAPGYPSSVSSAQVSRAQLSIVRSAAAELGAFASVLQPQHPAYPPLQSFKEGLLRSESTFWRAKRVPGLRYATSVRTAIVRAQHSIRIVGSGSLTLTARSGKLPVTVANETSVPATVRVVLAAQPEVRLKLTQPPALLLPPGQQQTIEVPAEASADGSVMVIARLSTTSGQSYGQPVTFQVEVSGYGTVAQIIVGTALILLAIAVVVRIAGAIRSGRRPGAPATVRELVR